MQLSKYNAFSGWVPKLATIPTFSLSPAAVLVVTFALALLTVTSFVASNFPQRPKQNKTLSFVIEKHIRKFLNRVEEL